VVPQSLRKFEVLCLRDFLARLIGRQVDGLRRRQSNPNGALRGAYGSRVGRFNVSMLAIRRLWFRKGVRLPVGYIALASEYLEVQMKCFVQLALPVVYQPLRDHHQCSGQFTA